MSFFGPERFSVLVASPRQGLATFKVQMNYLATLLKCRITQNIQDRSPGLHHQRHICLLSHLICPTLSVILASATLAPVFTIRYLQPSQRPPRLPASGPLSFPFPLHSPFTFTFLFCLF